MKYRRKPVEVEAISMINVLYGFKHGYELLPEWVRNAYENSYIRNVTDDSLFVDTLYGLVVANEEDYLIYENDEIKVKSAKVFEDNYEEVVE